MHHGARESSPAGNSSGQPPLAGPVRTMGGRFDGQAHLQAELRRLDLILERQVVRLRRAGLFGEDPFRGMHIPEAQVDALLGQGAASPARQDGEAREAALTAAIERAGRDIETRAQAGEAAGVCLPLRQLAQRFGLDRFELDAMVICVAPEVDSKYETLFAYAHNDVTRKAPSVGLVLSLLTDTLGERMVRRGHFEAGSPLILHHLLRLGGESQDLDAPLPARLVKADERVVEFLLGSQEIDARLRPFAQRLDTGLTLEALELPAGLRERLGRAVGLLADGRLLLYFRGVSGAGKRTTAGVMCGALGMPLLAADMTRALDAGIPLATVMALLRREAALQGAALYLDRADALLSDEQRWPANHAALGHALQDSENPVYLSSDFPWHPGISWPGTVCLHFDFPMPTAPQRLRLWELAARGNDRKPADDVDLAEIAGRFVLGPGQIEAAVREAGQLALLSAGQGGGVRLAHLNAAARAQCGHGLGRLAHKVKTPFTWDDLVLPPRTMQQLREISSSVRHRHQVHAEWGFERRLALGKGLNVLFCGASGTGKTTAASILANELELDLYRIDLSMVVSKYIGETEKNLSRIFDEARASNAILFFDEAEALFGKRSEVKDAHDRYANIEVAYLLQKVEEYEGIVILATNLHKNLDGAFARRLHHTVEFPFPDAPQREGIWRAMFPPEAPLAGDVDLQFLALNFEIAGGNIRNVVLGAAFLAADAGGPIAMAHLILAMAREHQKLGWLPSKNNFGQYYECIGKTPKMLGPRA